MADLTDLQAAISSKIVGSDSSGSETNAVGADVNGNLQVVDYSDGPVTPGIVAARSSLAGGQFNTVLPTLTSAQQSALQLDSSGRLIIRPLTSADVVSAVQSGAWTTGRTWTLASGTDSVAAVQSGTWTVQPGNTANTTAWFVTLASEGPVTPGTVATKSTLTGGQFNTTLPTLTNTQQSALQLDSRGRLIVTDVSVVADKTTFTYGTSTFQPIGGVFQDTSPTLTAGQGGAVRLTAQRAVHSNLRDNSGNEIGVTGNPLITNTSFSVLGGQLVPTITNKMRVRYSTTPATAGSAYSTIYTRSGTGLFFGFQADFNSAKVRLRLTIDSGQIFEITLEDLKLFQFNDTSTTRMQMGGFWATVGNTIDFSTKYAIPYTTSITIEMQRSDATNHTMNQYMVLLTEDT